ncbi:MAG: hypothetical protein FWD09_00460 [Lentimicrobiaceae bacterium]|nr:hypothetical protein [Lentimicrobiaceae bacterium]
MKKRRKQFDLEVQNVGDVFWIGYTKTPEDLHCDFEFNFRQGLFPFYFKVAKIGNYQLITNKNKMGVFRLRTPFEVVNTSQLQDCNFSWNSAMFYSLSSVYFTPMFLF